jgi:hypothetical protein
LMLGTKISVRGEKGILPQMALLCHLLVPVDRNAGEYHAATPEFILAASHTLSPVFSCGYNLGMEWEPGTPYPAYIYTATVGADITEKLYGFVEVFGDFRYKKYPVCMADGGFSYQPLPNFQIDISGGYGLNAYSDTFFLSCGFAIRLPH